MISIGIDPAYAKTTAVAIEYKDTTHLLLVAPYCWHSTVTQIKELKLPKTQVLCTIEGQEIYQKSRAKPEVILELANRSGYFEGLIRHLWDDVEVLRPTPKTWKKQVPAKVYMKRILKKYPEIEAQMKGLNGQEKEDLCHAFGLLKWGQNYP